ncbi:hypothetical protein EDB83DRAFT_2551269 [Lactarius deliciosus]|nr:hypothetical protein EDB83DRAFT_2551269 [Lactarius deliciosus]
MLEGAFVTKGPSPPSPLRDDDRDLFLTMAALGCSAEFPSSAYDQHAFSWGAPQPPLLDQSGQLCHLSIPQDPPQSPKVNAILESCRITDPSSGPSPSQNLYIFPCGPISEKAYDKVMGAYHSGSIQTSMAAIQESPVDSSATAIHIDERLMYPTTFPQAPWGYIDAFPGMSTNDHGSSLPYSVRQHEEAASHNFQGRASTATTGTSTPHEIPAICVGHTNGPLDEDICYSGTWSDTIRKLYSPSDQYGLATGAPSNIQSYIYGHTTYMIVTSLSYEYLTDDGLCVKIDSLMTPTLMLFNMDSCSRDSGLVETPVKARSQNRGRRQECVVPAVRMSE